MGATRSRRLPTLSHEAEVAGLGADGDEALHLGEGLGDQQVNRAGTAEAEVDDSRHPLIVRSRRQPSSRTGISALCFEVNHSSPPRRHLLESQNRNHDLLNTPKRCTMSVRCRHVAAFKSDDRESEHKPLDLLARYRKLRC